MQKFTIAHLEEKKNSLKSQVTYADIPSIYHVRNVVLYFFLKLLWSTLDFQAKLSRSIEVSHHELIHVANSDIPGIHCIFLK